MNLYAALDFSPCAVESFPDVRSLLFHLMVFVVGPLMVSSVSSHLVVGLTRLLFPLIPPSVTSFSVPRSCLTIHIVTKYLKAACVTLDSPFWFGVFEHPYTVKLLFNPLKVVEDCDNSTVGKYWQFIQFKRHRHLVSGMYLKYIITCIFLRQ